MAGPSLSEAAPASAPQSASDKAAEFEQFLDPEEDEDEEPQSEEQDGAEEGEDLELDSEETDEDGDEPETAIDPPVSLNAEEKKAFAAASPEAQQAWAAAETRRNTQVQEATTKASEAQRTADARAAQADAHAKAQYASQLDQFVAAFEPQLPDARLAYDDPARYIAVKAQYDADKAQHDQLVQHIRGVKTEAATEANEAFIAQRDRELMTIPEIANPETRKDYIERAMGVASDLGFDQAELAEGMSARDIKALAQVADWKADSAKYKVALSKQMQKVRASKGKTLRPNAAPQDSRAARGNQDWQRVKGARSKEAQAEAFADYMGL